MPATSSACRPVLIAVLTAVLAAPGAAAAHEPTAGGAAAAPARPAVTALKCDTGERRSCPQGELLSVRGEGLDTVQAVVFLGARGHADDLRARPRRRSPHRVLVEVPAAATSGPLRALSHFAGPSARSQRLRITPADGVLPQLRADGVFPVRGGYDFGTETNRFGGGRGHQGQDVFAACGTPIVAARAGTVSTAAYHARSGYHAVITAADGSSQAYMHMQGPPAVTAGERVAAGAAIGAVGQSGNAQGCHLHFEQWSAPGWHRGGAPIDPLPDLRRWGADGVPSTSYKS
jgi:hypothetical protein